MYNKSHETRLMRKFLEIIKKKDSGVSQKLIVEIELLHMNDVHRDK